MKISVLSVIAVLLLGALPVQSQVVFEETGLKAVFQQAREENKLVFIDCYTSMICEFPPDTSKQRNGKAGCLSSSPSALIKCAKTCPVK